MNHVVPHDQLGARVREVTDAIRRAPAPAVAATFDLYDEGQGLSQEEALALEEERGAAWVVDLTHFSSGSRVTMTRDPVPHEALVATFMFG